MSKPEFINQSREQQGRQVAALAKKKNTRLNKGDAKSVVDYANRLKDTL